MIRGCASHSPLRLSCRRPRVLCPPFRHLQGRSRFENRWTDRGGRLTASFDLVHPLAILPIQRPLHADQPFARFDIDINVQ